MSTVEAQSQAKPGETPGAMAEVPLERGDTVDKKDLAVSRDVIAASEYATKDEKAAADALRDEGDFTDEEYNKLKRKVDFILLPLMWWMYGIQQTDKTGLGTMNLFGLQTDTHMQGKQYSYLGVLFYVAYAIFEFPANWSMQRLNMGKTLTVYMFLWGIVVLVQGFLTNWAQFAGLRFVQGALECTISPGFNLIIARWYTTREHSSRTLVFQSANAGWGIIVDITFWAIAKRANAQPGGFAAWRGIEVFLGGQTLIAAALAWFLLGTPHEVRWLSAREKRIATARVLKNNAGTDLTGKERWNWDQFKEAFVDPALYFQFVNTFLITVMNGAITTFGTVVFEGFGFDKYQTIIYDIPRNAISVIWFVIVGWSSLKVMNIRMYWMMISCLIPFIALLVLALLPTDPSYKWVRMVMYWGTVVFTIPSFSAWALISSNTAGRTKFSTISAVTFIGYCLGNIAGTQVMKNKDAPHYIPGTTVIAVLMGVDVIWIIIWRFYLVWMNRKRAKIVAEMNLSPEEEIRRGEELGAQDVTDLKNPFFRYSM